MLSLRWLVPVSSRGEQVTIGFFRARLFLSCFKRNSLISGSVSTRTTLDNPLYPRQIVSRVQCSSFKGKTAIDRDGDWERKDSQNGYKNGELINFSKLSRLIVLATFCGLYFVCSTTTTYAGEGDEDKQDYESRRHKGCFASRRRIQCVKNLATAKKYRIQAKENQPEEGKDCEPPRKIKSRSQKVCCACVTPPKCKCCKLAGSTVTVPSHLFVLLAFSKNKIPESK